MKLSLSRVTLLLQFLATLGTDDDDVSSPHPLDNTIPPAVKNAAIRNGPQHHSDNSEHDVDNDASARIRTQAQHVELSNSTPYNLHGTGKTKIETAAEALHDDSLDSMPSMIPFEIMDMGRIQNDHTEVVIPVDAADEQIKSIGTRTRTDDSVQILDTSVHLQQTDEHGGHTNRGDTIDEPPQADIDRSMEAIPETSEDERQSIIHVQTIQEEDEHEHNDDDDVDDDEMPPNEVVVDYADKSTGAIILDKSPNFKGTNNLLLGNNDRYAIAPCEGDGVKYVIIGLSEDIEVNTIKLSSYERYSSLAKKFEVLGSTTYPISSKWEKLGTFEAKPWFKENGEQTFQLEHPSWCRYLKFRFITHYGVEHYCTVTEVKVHGSTTQQGFHMQWDNDNVEEHVEQQDELVVQQVQVDVASSGNEVSGERQKIEIIDGVGSTKSTSQNEKVIDDRDNDIATHGTDNHSQIHVGSINQINELAAREGRASLSNEAANDTPRRENIQKDDALIIAAKPHSIPLPSTDEATTVEKKPTHMEKLNQTIRPEMLDRMDTSGTDDAAPRTTNMRPNTGKPEYNASSETSRESGIRKSTSTGRLTFRRGLLGSRLLPHNSSNDPFTSQLHSEFSAIISASIKTASSKFVTEKAGVDATIASILGSQISLHLDSPTAPRSVKIIQNLIKTKVSSGKESAKATHEISDPVPQGVSTTVSKVVKDAIDSMKIMNMKGAPSLSGLIGIINNLVPEARQDSKTTGNIGTNVKDALEKVIAEVLPINADDSPAVRDTNSPHPSSFSKDTVVETKSESLVSKHDYLKSISDQGCLEELDFQVFKAKLSKTGGTGSVSGNGAAGGSKNEPIFKKLTDEIKVLQTSQSIHDQYVKAMTTCYEKVIIDFYKEITFLKVDQEERLVSMEEQIRLLGQKQEDGSLIDDMMVYLKVSYAFTCEFLKPAYEWLSSFLTRMIGLLLSFKMRVIENETVQEICRLTNYHIGEICAFFAGSIFCFLIVSLVWWSHNRKTAATSSYPIQIEDTADVKELQENENVPEEGSGKRKRKKTRRPRKQSKSKPQHMVVTDYSESSLCSINANSSFD